MHPAILAERTRQEAIQRNDQRMIESKAQIDLGNPQVLFPSRLDLKLDPNPKLFHSANCDDCLNGKVTSLRSHDSRGGCSVRPNDIALFISPVNDFKCEGLDCSKSTISSTVEKYFVTQGAFPAPFHPCYRQRREALSRKDIKSAEKMPKKRLRWSRKQNNGKRGGTFKTLGKSSIIMAFEKTASKIGSECFSNEPLTEREAMAVQLTEKFDALQDSAAFEDLERMLKDSVVCRACVPRCTKKSKSSSICSPHSASEGTMARRLRCANCGGPCQDSNAGYIDISCETVDPVERLPVNDSIMRISCDPLLDGCLSCDGVWPIHQSGPASKGMGAVTLADLFSVVEGLAFKEEDDSLNGRCGDKSAPNRKRHLGKRQERLSSMDSGTDSRVGVKKGRSKRQKSTVENYNETSSENSSDDNSVGAVTAVNRIADHLSRCCDLTEVRLIWKCRNNPLECVKIDQKSAKTTGAKLQEEEEEEEGEVVCGAEHGDTEADTEVRLVLSGPSSVETQPGKVCDQGRTTKLSLDKCILKTPSPLSISGKGGNSPSTARCTAPVNQNVTILKLSGSHPKTSLMMQTPQRVQASSK